VDARHHGDRLPHPEVHPEPAGRQTGDRHGAEVDQRGARDGAGQELRRGVAHPEGAPDDVGRHHPHADQSHPERDQRDPPSGLRQRDQQGRRARGHQEHDHRAGVAPPGRGPAGDRGTDQPADAPGRHHDADPRRVEAEVAHEEEHEQGGVPGEGEVRCAALEGEEPQVGVAGHHPDAGRDLAP